MSSLEKKIKSGSRMINAENPIEVINIGRPGDPTQILVYKGKIYIYNSAGQTLIDGGYVSARAIKAAAVTAEKLSLGAKKFIHNIVWTATDYNTCSWSAGVIKFADGTTDNTSSGNTGNITQKTYIYYNGTSTLQKTTSYSSAISNSNIPLAIVEPVVDTDAKCIITSFVNVGTTIDGDLIITGKIQSVDTKTYFDLNNKRIIMNDGSNNRVLIGDLGSGQYGMKISKATYDVITTSAKNLIFTTVVANQYKTHVKGSFTFTANNQVRTVSHGLSYTPSYIAYEKNSGYSYYNFRQGGQDYINSSILSFTSNNGDIVSYLIFKDSGA